MTERRKFEDDMSTVEHDPVNHPSHYNQSRFIHSVCGHPIEVIDITRHLSFDRGNGVKYALRAGEKVEEGEDPLEAEIRDLKKDRWYIDDEIRELERRLAAKRVARADRENREIREGLEAARETEDILSDPETMAAIAEGTAELSRREEPLPQYNMVLLSVYYRPTGDNDPWGAKVATEAVYTTTKVRDFKAMIVEYFGFGNPDGFELQLGGLPLREDDTIGQYNITTALNLVRLSQHEVTAVGDHEARYYHGSNGRIPLFDALVNGEVRNG